MRCHEKKIAVAAALVALAVALGACGSSDDGDGASSAGDASFDLRLGNILSFTGDLSPYGPSIDAANSVAVQHVNDALRKAGLAEQISVEIIGSEDDQTKIQPAVEAATKLVDVEQADVIVGTISSGSTIAVAQSVTIPRGILQVAPTSSSPAITELEDDGLVFRILPPDTFQARELVQVVGSELGADATVNLGYRNDDWGNAVAPLFTELWEQGGGEVGVSLSWNPEAPNFNTEAQKLAGGGPDGWVILDFPPTFAKMAPGLVRSGAWDPTRTFVPAEMREADALKDIGEQATEGLHGVAPTAGKTPLRDQLDALFRREAPGKPVTGFESTGFDATVLVSLSAIAAGSSDPAEIKEHMRDVSGPGGTKYDFTQLPQAIKDLRAGRDIDYEGVSGPIDWDEAGDPSATKFELWRVKEGAPETVEVFSIGESG
jgi:ABC-type branched-subunit amino acid transport system substrate-binding protein